MRKTWTIARKELAGFFDSLIAYVLLALFLGLTSLARADKPTVTVSTKKISDKIEVKVKDNGDGIPQKVMEKIFQPFFTTKPTGQGTGCLLYTSRCV